MLFVIGVGCIKDLIPQIRPTVFNGGDPEGLPKIRVTSIMYTQVFLQEKVPEPLPHPEKVTGPSVPMVGQVQVCV